MTVQQGQSTASSMGAALKSWIMVFLALIFVILYGAALLGKVKPLSDVSMVTRLEPIIFVIIGYYFGRLPAQQNEETLKVEIARQTQKADAAQHAKEQALQAREILEEKVKNARAVLASVASNKLVTDSNEHVSKSGGLVKDEAILHSVNNTLGILNT